MNPTALRVLTAMRRVRLLAVLAGVAWLLGVTPPAGVRLLLAVLVALALGLDALADAANDTPTLPADSAKGRRT